MTIVVVATAVLMVGIILVLLWRLTDPRIPLTRGDAWMCLKLDLIRFTGRCLPSTHADDDHYDAATFPQLDIVPLLLPDSRWWLLNSFRIHGASQH